MNMEPRFLWNDEQLSDSQSITDLALIPKSDLENLNVTK